MRRLAIMMTALASTALAQDRPPVRPVRDVAVEYRSSGMGQTASATMTMHFANKGARIRIDSPDHNSYVAFDTNTNHTLVVLLQKRSYIDQPTDPAQIPPFFSPNGDLAKSGTATIAGIRCTNYQATINRQDGQLCLTDDGVLLRVQSGEQGQQRALEAVRVTYEVQPSTLFEPPAGFQKTEPPQPRRGMTDDGPLNPPRGSYWGIQTGR